MSQTFPLELWLKEFKEELEKIFSSHGELDTRTKWLDCAGTAGWNRAMIKTASKSNQNLGYSIILFYHNLSWNESDDFDSWLIDMAAYYNLITDK